MTQVLNQLVYQKGGWVLHMLRGVVGTDAFWAGIRDYYRRYRDRNVSTDDFRRVMEAASRQDLAWFFDQWLKRSTSPSFEGGWRYNPTARRIEVELNQTQAGEAYRVPVEFGITSAGEPAMRIERVVMTEKGSRYTIAADTEPVAVAFDPNTWLLMTGATFRKLP